MHVAVVPASCQCGAMTAAPGTGMPKYAQVAAGIRGQIADGTLRPGQPAPSGAALSRLTGYSTLTCRKALRVLIADGLLTPGPSRNARPRVAAPPRPSAERNLADISHALSAALAGRRRAAGLTQSGLAGLAAVSVTTIGHAETGRLWQSRRFWERADAALGAGGELLRLHDAYRAAGAAQAQFRSRSRPDAPRADGVVTLPAQRDQAHRDERAVAADDPPGASPGASPAAAGAQAAASLQVAGDAPVPAAGQAAPCYIMIVWADGTVTTVRPPDSALRGDRRRPPGPEALRRGPEARP